MNPEVEEKIRGRIDWQEEKLKDQLCQFGPNSNASGMTQAYISALKWVLEIAKSARQEESLDAK